MLCTNCGKEFDVQGNRCPDCGTVYDVQFAPPRIESHITKIPQTTPTVIPKNVPLNKFSPSAGWIVTVSLLGIIMLAAILFAFFS